jgi:hypothetical protein
MIPLAIIGASVLVGMIGYGVFMVLQNITLKNKNSEEDEK